MCLFVYVAYICLCLWKFLNLWDCVIVCKCWHATSGIDRIMIIIFSSDQAFCVNFCLCLFVFVCVCLSLFVFVCLCLSLFVFVYVAVFVLLCVFRCMAVCVF